MNQFFLCKHCQKKKPFSKHVILYPQARVWMSCANCGRKALIYNFKVIEWEKIK